MERQLQIMTEAAYRLGSEADLLCPGTDWKGIRGLGNILRHGYHRIDDVQVWQVIQRELPALREAVSTAMNRLAKPSQGEQDEQ